MRLVYRPTNNVMKVRKYKIIVFLAIRLLLSCIMLFTE